MSGPLFQAVSAVGTLLGGAGALMGATRKPPAPAPLPTPKPVTTMPAPDDEAAEQARRRRVREAQTRSGRLSTLLTDNLGTTLG